MLIISEEKLNGFLEGLKNKFDFFDVKSVPPAGGLPPKQYFFPPEETTFEFQRNKKNKTSGNAVSPKSPKNFILFGLSLKELEAITYLDEIMRKPKKDFFYFQKREKAILIGVTSKHFDIPPGGDIILRKLDNGNYEALGVTKKGNELIKKQKLNFSETRGSLKHKISTSKTMPRLRELLLDPELLKEAIKWSWRNRPDIWENLAGKCLGCGICTYVCPLCHCFSVEDKIELSGDSCKRCRKWDACTLPGFAKVTGGHNFHQSIKERYYNWFYHKFVRGYLEFGKSQCVACGKCKEHCPAGIDIEDVIIDAVSAYRVSEA